MVILCFVAHVGNNVNFPITISSESENETEVTWRNVNLICVGASTEIEARSEPSRTAVVAVNNADGITSVQERGRLGVGDNRTVVTIEITEKKVDYCMRTNGDGKTTRNRSLPKWSAMRFHLEKSITKSGESCRRYVGVEAGEMILDILIY